MLKLIAAMVLIPVIFMGMPLVIWIGEIACCYVAWHYFLKPQVDAYKKASQTNEDENSKSSP